MKSPSSSSIETSLYVMLSGRKCSLVLSFFVLCINLQICRCSGFFPMDGYCTDVRVYSLTQQTHPKLDVSTQHLPLKS